MKEKNISLLHAKEIHENLEATKEKLQKFLEEQKNIYVSFDIDGLDPSIAPGTGYREEDGLTEKEAFDLLEQVLETGKVKAADLVEIKPKLDKEGKTVSIGKKILEKLIKNT